MKGDCTEKARSARGVLPPPAAGLTWRMGWMGRAPGTLDFVGRLRQTAAVGEGLTSTLAALGLQRCSGAMPPPGHAFLAGSLFQCQHTAARGGQAENVQGSLKPPPFASPSPRAAPQTWVINRCSWCGPPRRNSRDTAFASKWMQPAVLGTDGRKEEKMVKKRYGGFVPVPGPGR